VVAALAQGGQLKSSTQSIDQGKFSFDLLFTNDGCNLGASSYAGGALYIDTDHNGACDLPQDPLFVWTTYGGPAGSYQTTTLTPDAARCSLTYPADRDALAAAQSLCPGVGACLDFCQPADLHGVGGFGAVCDQSADAGM
jgi:hypothetical protein